MERSRRLFFPLLPLALASVILGWRLWVQYRGLGFAGGEFLALNDALTSFAREGRWFQALGETRSRFALEFMPSLALWSLPMALFPSNFTLLALILASWTASLWAFDRVLRALTPEAAPWERGLACAGLLLNPYALGLLEAARPEIFFVPLALLAYESFLRGRLGAWAAWLALALGVRQEAGVFMFVMYLPFLFEPGRRRPAAFGLLACATYVLLAVGVGMPAFGGEAWSWAAPGWWVFSLPMLGVNAWLLWSELRARALRPAQGLLGLFLLGALSASAGLRLFAAPAPMPDGVGGDLAGKVLKHLELCPNARSVSGDERLLGAVPNRFVRLGLLDEAKAEWRLRYENGMVWGSGRDGFECEGGWFSQEQGR